MTSQTEKNHAIETAFKALEHVFTTYSNARTELSNKYPLGHSNRFEVDLSEVEKAHISLLQSRLEATIAEEQLKGLAKSTEENARFARLLFVLNLVIAASTVFYTIITWRSVAATGNAIQQQILQLQKSPTPDGIHLVPVK